MYRTRIIVNGCYWNTCKLVFIKTRTHRYSDSYQYEPGLTATCIVKPRIPSLSCAHCVFQSTSTSIFGSLADSTAGKLLGLFSSDKDKTPLPSSLIISVDDTLRPDVFPSVDCSPFDDKIEVVHLRGVNRCRKRGPTCAQVNGDGSERRSSPESGYRSIVNDVSSPLVVSSDISSDSLVSGTSCRSSLVTSPPYGVHSDLVDHFESSDVHVAVSQPSEIQHEAPSIVTRTPAEDKLIQSILEEHCKYLCSPAVTDSSTSSTMPSDVGDANDRCAIADNVVSLSVGDTIEEEIAAKSDGSRLQQELNSEESEAVLTACVPSPVEDEISIYDDGRLSVRQQLGAAVRESAAESDAGFGELSVICRQRQEQEQTSCWDPVSPLLPFNDNDSLVSDTQLSRTSSVSSALSLEPLAHSSEIR